MSEIDNYADAQSTTTLTLAKRAEMAIPQARQAHRGITKTLLDVVY